MFKRPRKLFWSTTVLIITSAAAFSIANFSGKAQRKPGTENFLQIEQDVTQTGVQPTDKQLADASAPIVDLTSPKAPVLDERRRKRNKSFDNMRVESIETTPGSDDRVVVSESNIPDLPVAMSDLIVEGIVSDSAAFLSDDKTGIYSEFSISVTGVTKSSSASPVKNGDVITGERYGGRVRFPSGQIARYRVAGQGAPRKDCKYLFFLKKKEDGNYLILTAYEIRNKNVFALDGSRINPQGKGNSSFDKHNGRSVEDFWKEVNAAVKEETR